MAEDDGGVGVAHDARRGHVVVLLDGEYLRAHDARVLGNGHQADGHDGRQQGRDGTVNRADNLSVTFCECGCGKNTCKGEYDEQEFPKASHAW